MMAFFELFQLRVHAKSFEANAALFLMKSVFYLVCHRKEIYFTFIINYGFDFAVLLNRTHFKLIKVFLHPITIHGNIRC